MEMVPLWSCTSSPASMTFFGPAAAAAATSAVTVSTTAAVSGWGPGPTATRPPVFVSAAHMPLLTPTSASIHTSLSMIHPAVSAPRRA